MTDQLTQLIKQQADTQNAVVGLLERMNDPNPLTKVAASVQTANQLHGLGGLWSTTVDRDVLTAHIRPEGISTILPLLSSIDEDPRYGTITGYTDPEGAEPDNACEDAPAGFVKGCTLTARFGLTRRDTNTIEFDKVMLRRNRGDFMDLQLRGRVLGLSNLHPPSLNERQILNILTKSEMVTAGVNAERKLIKEIWQGTFGVSTEFPGLDSQIVTGQVDVDSGIACPAMDSDVKDFAFDDVEGGGRSIVEYISMLEWFIFFNARRMGLAPASWVWAMRPELWQVFTEVWPCQYNTGKCATSLIGGQSRVVIDGRENIAERDEMRRSMTLEVNGRRYPVVIDDGIFEQDSTNDANLNPGDYASSIYFVPLTVTGNFPVTFMQYLDYRNTIADQNVALLMGRQDFWTDSGVWSWAIEQIKWCYKLALKTEQRIVLRTPQLAGKLDNVRYSPLQHLRSSDPASPYFADGGVSVRNSDPVNAVWA